HALALAKLCAFMAPEGVRFDLLTRGAPHLPPPLNAALADDIAFEEARETLANWSLARIGRVTLDVPEMLCRDAGIAQTAPGFGVHRLQQRVTREWLEQGAAWRAAAEAVAEMLGGVFPSTANTGKASAHPESWPLCALLTPQTAALAAATAREGAERLPVRAFDTALNQAGVYLYARGDRPGALRLLERSVAVKALTVGAAHPEMATALSNLAGRYVDLGRWPAAAEAFDRALAIDSALFPPSAPTLAIRHSSRGELEWKQRAAAAASARNLRAAAIDRRAGNARQEAISLNNLGAVVGDWAAASGDAGLRWREAGCGAAALAATRAAEGDAHPSTAIRCHNLAVWFWTMGDAGAAAGLAERAVATMFVLGMSEHPSTLRRSDELATIYDALDHPEKAARLRAVDVSDLDPVVDQIQADHAHWRQTGEPVPLDLPGLDRPEIQQGYEDVSALIDAEIQQVEADAVAWRKARGLKPDGSEDAAWRERAIADPSIVPDTPVWSPDRLAEALENKWIKGLPDPDPTPEGPKPRRPGVLGRLKDLWKAG
ncbi:MAG: tetratricopeptide repeat protein, partial [Pseudomonadota bacterium]